jgi:hypothetical protein
MAAPQVLVEFQNGAGGAGVFAVSDSVVTLRARWISEDTLEISYPPDAHVIKKEVAAQHGSDRVTIRYNVVRSADQR